MFEVNGDGRLMWGEFGSGAGLGIGRVRVRWLKKVVVMQAKNL